ncbi:hypothetical protein EVB87_161 [Rhizobium phage RHph_N28_1]|nr:hypothetical protein EVB87_161 [Rhizobium phage RHph_N28_1]QIG74190.1 hypothetical protein EVC07_162 [Rhizobium phage RHph_N42]QXV73848.1 hypothetical protein [Rhizobium phage RHph_N46]
MKINLADLKNNVEVVQHLLTATEKNKKAPPALKAPKPKSNTDYTKRFHGKQKEEKVKEFKPAEAADKDDLPAIMLPTEPAPVKVKQDDDTLARYRMVERHIDQAETYFKANPPIYKSMRILFSSAYRYANGKDRLILAQARQLCDEALTLQEAGAKRKAKAKQQGKTIGKRELESYSTKSLHSAIADLFVEMRAGLAEEAKRREGTSYNDKHKEYPVDLSSYDATMEPAVLARAHLMVTAANYIDVEDINKIAKHGLEVEHVEGLVFVIKNALLLGFMPHSLPRRRTDDDMEEELERAMAVYFQRRASPLVKQLRHATSNRQWFYVPEYSHLQVKSIAFADRALNPEFDAFKSLSNTPTEDEIRFFFLNTGVGEDRVNAILQRWRTNDSHQGRIALISNEYNAIVRQKKTARLREMRLGFLADNGDLVRSIESNIDRRQQILEEQQAIGARFSMLASHTGNADQGLSIRQYRHVTPVFSRIEDVAVKGITDAYERRRVREGIRSDRFEARTLRYQHTDLQDESRACRAKSKRGVLQLEALRAKAFADISGR